MKSTRKFTLIGIVMIMLMLMVFTACQAKNDPPAPAPANPGAEVEQIDYPKDKISVLVHQQAGGAVDVTTRLICDYLQKELGVPVVIENVTGAGGRKAFADVYADKSGGYVLSSVNIPTLPIGEVVFDGAYDSLQTTYISSWVDAGHVIAVKDDSSIKDFNDFVEKLKTDRVTIGTFGRGSSSHLQIETLLNTLDTKNGALVHFDGGASNMAALVGKNVDVSITGYGSFARTEGVRAIAVVDNARVDGIDAPTVGELGYNVPVLSEVYGLIGPPGMEPEKVKRLEELIEKASKDPTIIEQFKKLQYEVEYKNTATFTDLGKKYYESVKEYQDLLK